MQKNKTYPRTRFPSRVIEEAYDVFLSALDPKKKVKPPQSLDITRGSETWSFDSFDEFLAEYPKAQRFHFDHIAGDARLILWGNPRESEVKVRFSKRSQIEAVFQIFERNLDQSRIVVEPEPITVFVGHGNDPQWRDLKDHLQDQHGLKVVAYEIGPRAGQSVKEVLETMLAESSFALLVLTGEDQYIDGEVHARENVIHELGLFQGTLRFTRAIALLEDGVKEFSNILGVNQVRFGQGNIREAFGDVVATIRREFAEEE